MHAPLLQDFGTGRLNCHWIVYFGLEAPSWTTS